MVNKAGVRSSKEARTEEEKKKKKEERRRKKKEERRKKKKIKSVFPAFDREDTKVRPKRKVWVCSSATPQRQARKRKNASKWIPK